MDGSDAAIEVARARAGDEEAFRSLVERHSAAVFRLAFRLTGNESDAEDVVQETFFKAFRQLERFEERARFGSWLHRIAANCAFDLLRSRRGRAKDGPRARVAGEAAFDEQPASDPTPDRLLQSLEVHSRVQVALRRLSEQERAAFVLRHFEQMSTREIGRALGVDESAAKQSVFRAVRKLRDALLPFVATPARTETR
jgi:RNA polymerase sigma-70 factor, ECF subfamily